MRAAQTCCCHGIEGLAKEPVPTYGWPHPRATDLKQHSIDGGTTMTAFAQRPGRGASASRAVPSGGEATVVEESNDCVVIEVGDAVRSGNNGFRLGQCRQDAHMG